jgi:hypothetical protein
VSVSDRRGGTKAKAKAWEVDLHHLEVFECGRINLGAVVF